tara:strand:+ start:2097 stop:2381 length:285 start_codon:yes stop_codon:yes gene_type:complete
MTFTIKEVQARVFTEEVPARTKTYSIEPYLDYVEATGIEPTNSSCMAYIEMQIEDDFPGDKPQIIPLHAPENSSTCLTGVDTSNATASLDVPSY